MLWMWFARVDITTQALGYVVPESNFTSIDTMVDGQVVEVKVKQGDLVKKGDVILIINPGVGYEPYNVIANINGRIQTLNYRNPGAVVKKGETIVLLVPADQKLIVSGKLYVKDRGYIKVGQSAKIKLANQDQLTFGPINAKIISISPNAIQSEKGTWYEIELELEQQKFTSGNIDYTLVPGIQVQIFILTGDRSILSYITNPFYNSIGQALQER
jgi:multidrug efflux pump subunit AcrA (membrane-fusion protein)